MGRAAVIVLSALLLAVPPPGSAYGDEYRLGDGDVIRVTVFGHDDLTTAAAVEREGRIRYPLLGEVPVGGLTTGEAGQAIATGLAAGFIVDPQVSVAVVEYRTKKVNVIGKVSRPGVYEFRGRVTLLELISRAGGLAHDAGDEATVNRRATAGSVRAGKLLVDLRALIAEGRANRDVELLDGDSVYVSETGTYSISGEVRRPGSFRAADGMTLIRAVTLAGGFTERADTSRVRIVREGGESPGQILEVDATAAGVETPVRAGDIVVVNLSRPELCYVTGEVKNAGAYRCDDASTVLKAVTLAGGFTDAAAKDRIRIIRASAGGGEQVRKNVALDDPVLAGDVIIIPASFF